MVLSNKKLKQKLREELAKSLSASLAGHDSNPQSESLKDLLGSVKHKPRLSKREKKRKSLSSDEFAKKRIVRTDGGDDRENEDGERSEETKKSNDKKRKKRKRDEVQNRESDGVKDSDDVLKESKKSRKKKKAKKKKNKKKDKKEKSEEQKVEGEKPKVEETNLNVERHVDGIVPNKVYVGGIPYYYTEDDIRSYFKGCGNIIQVNCKMRPEDGEFSGIAFITFETEDGAKRALALDRAAMGERFLTIQQYMNNRPKKASDFAPEMVDGYNRVYVGNLAWDIAERDIRKLFSDCVITSIRFGKNKETGEFKGYVHVDFKDHVSMAMALKLDQEIVHGRPVKISCAVPKQETNSNSGSLSVMSEADNHTTDSKATPITIEAGNSGSTTAIRGKPVTIEAGNSVTTTALSGKIRRRTCYECGEKGHLSSACPKKQNADQTNTNTA